MSNREECRKRAEAMEQGKFQGYMAAKIEDIGDDIQEIKENDKEQWRAIDKAKWWNRAASALAAAALAVAAYFGIGKGGN